MNLDYVDKNIPIHVINPVFSTNKIIFLIGRRPLSLKSEIIEITTDDEHKIRTIDFNFNSNKIVYFCEESVLVFESGINPLSLYENSSDDEFFNITIQYGITKKSFKVLKLYVDYFQDYINKNIFETK